MKRHAHTSRIEISRRAGYPDPRRLRERLGMTALQFANCYGFAVGTVRDWDCQRYAPDRMARAYLRRIALFPDLLREENLTRRSR